MPIQIFYRGIETELFKQRPKQRALAIAHHSAFACADLAGMQAPVDQDLLHVREPVLAGKSNEHVEVFAHREFRPIFELLEYVRGADD